ncbi:LOW QUALITY PROTEIN: hypothetical protein HID58_074878 [Brassica napus]|uniref:Uncharacterized protein n=1 Tax=Brassica napus TaxID=3708 RepID=A0ABQ7YI82_BRANA|nr:LOW QUALITY PROTEIN: hypothetical protein HID58_074878 [Brassica napus]
MFGEMHPPDLKMLETNSGVRGSGGSFGGKAQASSSNTTEASFGLNSQTAERVQGSKDKDSGAAVDAVCGVNPASSNILQQNSTQQEKQKICALGTIMENESKKRAHVETAEDAVCGVNPDNMHQQNCMLQEKEKSCGEGTVVEYGSKKRANIEAASGENKRDDVENEDEDEDEDEDDEDYDYNEEEYEDEDDDEDEDDGENEYKDDVGNEDTNEDDKDYDYNGWHEFVGNDCERDEDDDFVDVHQKEGVVDGLVVTVMSVLGSPKGQGSGRGQWSRATGGSSSSKQRCNMRHYEDNTDQVRDFVCTSRMVDFSYTKDSDIGGSVDVVHVTPPKDRNQQNHDDDSVDRRFTKSSSETVRCALTFATGNSDVGNVVLVTPPQQNEKHRRVIEDDDEYFDPPLTDTTLVHGGGAPKTGTLSCAHNDETPTGESDHIVLVTPHKQYNKHNRVIEADDEFVSPPFTQTNNLRVAKHASQENIFHLPFCTHADGTDTGASVDLDRWYPSAHHGICLVHLKRNVDDKYKGLQQKQMVGRAA